MPIDHAAVAKMYIDAVKGNAIEASVLTKLPELVTCNDWTRVEVIGSVDYLSERTKIVYNGMIVKYSGGLYYIRKKLADALGEFDRRFKNVRNSVRVS